MALFSLATRCSAFATHHLFYNNNHHHHSWIGAHNNLSFTSFRLAYKSLSLSLSTSASSSLSSPKEVHYFAYGDNSFESIRKNKHFYVDKTHLIPHFEKNSKHLIFLRPPRFGKSLLLNMMGCYYDIKKKDQFNDLFDGLWIKNNPTPLRNTFHVLSLDFSIDVDGDVDTIRQSLHKSINTSLEEFRMYYNTEFEIDPTHSFTSLVRMASCLKVKNQSLLILVDEYDRFANKLMNENPEAYNKIIAGKSGDPLSSPIRSFYETLKKITLPNYRTISTGISPIALADASGANMIEDISQNSLFADAAGFTKDDLIKAFHEIGISDENQKNALAVMKKYYDGYRFIGSQQPFYNSTLSLYFLKKYYQNDESFRDFVDLLNKNLATEEISNLIDDNVVAGDNVMSLLIKAAGMDNLISELLIKSKLPFGNFQGRFKLRELIEMTDPNKAITHQNRAISFMIYHGMLTYCKKTQASNESEDNNNEIGELDREFVRIPNEIARILFINKLAEQIKIKKEELSSVFDEPNSKSLKEFLQNNVISLCETKYDNFFSEGAFHAQIKLYLELFNKHVGGGYFKKIENDYPLEPNSNPDKSKKVDIFLETNDTIILVELKRIRPNALVSATTTQAGLRVAFHDLKQKDDKSLRNMKILSFNEDYVKKEKIHKSAHKNVAELEKAAKLQLTEYVDMAKKLNLSKKLYAFTVVQVGLPILVKEYTEK